MKDRELQAKLRELAQKGYIENEQLERIESEYLTESNKRNALMLTFALFGILFVGLGIISIFAFNWEYIPKWGKVIIAFIPLLCIQSLLYWKWKTEGSKIWIQSLCLGEGIAFLFAVGLINQVYQISVGLDIILLITFIIMLPVIYLFNAYYLALLCLGGVLYYSTSITEVTYSLLVILIIPFYAKSLKDKEHAPHMLSLAMLIWGVQLIYLTLDLFEANHIVIYLLLFIIFTRINWNPIFRKVGLFCFYFTSIAMSIGHDILTFTTYIEGVVILVLMAVLGYQGYRSKDKEANKESLIFLIQPLLIGIGGIFELHSGYIILFDVYVLIILVRMIIIGTKEKGLGGARRGSILLCIFIAIKLFTSSFPLSIKGAGFLLIGIAFLVANIKIAKGLEETR